MELTGVRPDASILRHIFPLERGSGSTSYITAPVAQSSSADLSFTPTFTMYLSLLMNPSGAPLAPTGLTVTVAATGSIGLSWSAAADNGSPVLTYTVSYSPGNGLQTESATCPPGTCQATINSLANCVEYTFTVKATNALGTGPSSAPVSGIAVQTADAPAQPTAAPGTAGASIFVGWSAPNAHGCAIDKYDIQVYQDTTFVKTVETAISPSAIGGLTTCNYPGGTCGASYTFYVRAHNAGGWSGRSAGNSAIPRVSYLADNLRGVWSKTYGNQSCTSCHAGGGPAPNLANQAGFPPADYVNSKSEGVRMYTCPAHESSCPFIMNGYTLFSVGSIEYNTVKKWVEDGSLQ